MAPEEHVPLILGRTMGSDCGVRSIKFCSRAVPPVPSAQCLVPR